MLIFRSLNFLLLSRQKHFSPILKSLELSLLLSESINLSIILSLFHATLYSILRELNNSRNKSVLKQEIIFYMIDKIIF